MHEQHPPPSDRQVALGLVLLKGPRGGLFLMSEVLLYMIGTQSIGALHGGSFLTRLVQILQLTALKIPLKICV